MEPNSDRLFVGVDLAWAEGSAAKIANESGVVCIDGNGRVLHAGWTIGVTETANCIQSMTSGTTEAVLFVDAPLVVANERGQRLCERQVGQRYGSWLISANSTNRATKNKAGVTLLEQLEKLGWTYDSGHGGPNPGKVVSECYPWTTIVGAEELGYGEPPTRPGYKRKPRKMKVAEFRPLRAADCDQLLTRMANLIDADPPLDLRSHEITGELVTTLSPLADRAYKHREDLLDAALCAWTASVWARWGTQRCQVLGEDQAGDAKIATIIAPTRSAHRR